MPQGSLSTDAVYERLESLFQAGKLGAAIYVSNSLASYGKSQGARIRRECETNYSTKKKTDPRVLNLLTTLPERDQIPPGNSSSKRPAKQEVAKLPELYRFVKYSKSFKPVKSIGDIRRNTDHIAAAIDPKTKKTNLFITPKPAESYPARCLDKLKEWERMGFKKAEVFGYVGIAVSIFYKAYINH